MENLIEKLQQEAGLTAEQAIKAVSVVKDYMDKEGLDIDWDKFFKGKSEEFLNMAKGLFSDVSRHTQIYTDKFVDKVDEFADKARKKASDFFNEK
jgi:methionyl-tRNA synthetase